jgi:orotate phosphoribosyltransferase
MQREMLGKKLFETSHLTGEFLLRDGRVLSEYFDKYQFESDPALLEAVAAHLAPLVPPDVEVLAGLELGGVPLGVVLSLRTGLTSVIVRKQVKEYGTRRMVEGSDVRGKRVLILDDIVSTGAQVIESATVLRNLGAIVAGVVCVIERQHGGRETIEALGFPLRHLFTEGELQRLAR